MLSSALFWDYLSSTHMMLLWAVLLSDTTNEIIQFQMLSKLNRWSLYGRVCVCVSVARVSCRCRTVQDPDEVVGNACMAWGFYEMTRARKLEPSGCLCHYCKEVLDRHFDKSYQSLTVPTALRYLCLSHS